MSPSTLVRLGTALASITLTLGVATAAPPHGGGGPRPGGGNYAPRYYAPPYTSGYRGVSIGIGIGSGYGSGLYSPLGYGLGYSPFGYSGLPYGGVGYGALGYGYGYPGGSLIGVPTIPRTYTPQYQPRYPSLPVQPLRDPNAEPIPLPLPADSAESSPAKITVITSEGAKVTFEGIESDQTGTRHSFTTKPLSTGGEVRVKVTVDGSTISIGVRGGEKATVDMRK